MKNTMSRQTHGGKGDAPRKVNNAEKFASNWDAIFGKKEKKTCARCDKEVADEGFWHEDEGKMCDSCGMAARDSLNN